MDPIFRDNSIVFSHFDILPDKLKNGGGELIGRWPRMMDRIVSATDGDEREGSRRGQEMRRRSQAVPYSR